MYCYPACAVSDCFQQSVFNKEEKVCMLLVKSDGAYLKL